MNEEQECVVGSADSSAKTEHRHRCQLVLLQDELEVRDVGAYYDDVQVSTTDSPGNQDCNKQ